MNINGLYALYEDTYGRQSVCNHNEMQAFLDQKPLFIDAILDAMLARVGQPSVKHATSYNNLPVVEKILNG